MLSLSMSPAAPLFGLAHRPEKPHTLLLSVLERMAAARPQVTHRLIPQLSRRMRHRLVIVFLISWKKRSSVIVRWWIAAGAAWKPRRCRTNINRSVRELQQHLELAGSRRATTS